MGVSGVGVRSDRGWFLICLPDFWRGRKSFLLSGEFLMKWFDRFTFVMKSSVTTLREKIEDPERMLHQLVCDMEEELETVRGSVTEAMADSILLSKQVIQAKADAETWSARAVSALKRGDESGAKAALDQKLRCDERAAMIESGCNSQKVQVEKLQASYRELEDRIRQARHKRTLLVARLTRAESAGRINRALDRASGQSAFAEFSRLERRVDRAEALSEASDRLEGRDPDADELEARFEAEEHRTRLEEELDALRQRVTATE